MALIKRESVEQVVAAADMVAIVGGRTQLRKSGARWVGLCPFHSEKTPSFGINPIEKLFYCHGCHKGGDLITFVRETENLDFADAVEWLADRTGTVLEFEETSPAEDARRKRRDRLDSLLEDAAGFYSRYLWDTPAGEPVRRYLAQRGFSEQVCRDFRLGLSPGGDRLVTKARDKGYTHAEIKAAGLVKRGGLDHFAGRLIFPLSNRQGRVRGFGARRLAEDDALGPKYVNSPEGERFRKSEIVYGLHHARTSMAKEGAIVVEGYTDVLVLHQRGRRSAVASMGTALTEDQLRELGYFTRRLFLCFDADAAGDVATLRGMDLAASKGFDVLIVPLPRGADPASAPEAFEDRLEKAESFARYRVELEIKKASSKEEAFQNVRNIISRFEHNTEWLEAVRLAADRLGLPPDVDLAGVAPETRRATGTISRRTIGAGQRLEREFLAVCTVNPDLAERYLRELDERHFDDPLHRRLRAYLVGEGEADDELLELRAELDATAEREGLNDETARQIFLRLEERLVRRELSELEGGDLERTVELQGVLAKIREALREGVPS